MFTKSVIILIGTTLLFCTNISSCTEKLEHLNKRTFEQWGEYCVTKPSKKLGKCVQLDKCDHVHDVPNNAQFVKDNICGSVSYTPLVCCPLDSENVAPHSSLLKTKCNSPTSFNIRGGKDAAPYTSPWIVLLSFEQPLETNKTFICGGSLINERYVVTAAHCLKSSDSDRPIASIHLGEWDFNNTVYEGNLTKPIDVGIDEVIPHPLYRTDSKLFDIGLIRLDQTLNKFSDNMRPINLPFNYDYYGLENRISFQISGFGETETEPTSATKKSGNIQNVPYVECRELYNAHGAEIQQIQLCGTSENTDSCHGDSGGSLAKMLAFSPDEEPCFYLMGIVSFGARPCGGSQLPSIYTNILPFLEWISSTIKA